MPTITEQYAVAKSWFLFPMEMIFVLRGKVISLVFGCLYYEIDLDKWFNFLLKRNILFILTREWVAIIAHHRHDSLFKCGIFSLSCRLLGFGACEL